MFSPGANPAKRDLFFTSVLVPLPGLWPVPLPGRLDIFTSGTNHNSEDALRKKWNSL